MTDHRELAYRRICAELGKVYGEMVAAQEEATALRSALAALRAQPAPPGDRIQKEVD